MLEEDNRTNHGIALDLFNFEEFDNKEEVQEENIAGQIKERLDQIDLNKLSPLEALSLLYELKEMK